MDEYPLQVPFQMYGEQWGISGLKGVRKQGGHKGIKITEENTTFKWRFSKKLFVQDILMG